jgi:hypothetical protein
VENRYHANHPSGPGRHHSEPDTPFLFNNARTASRANKTCANAGQYLHEALEHEFEEQISRDTFRNAVQDVANWLRGQVNQAPLVAPGITPSDNHT